MLKNTFWCALAFLLYIGAPSANAQEALCAEVKIEIMQELTMERQGFEALMRITIAWIPLRWRM